MLTQCPHCKTTFRLQLDQLQAAAGKVRCGHCNTTFDALENLTEAHSDTPATAPLSDDADTLDAFIEELSQSANAPPPASEQPTPPSDGPTTLREDVISAAFESLDMMAEPGANPPGPPSAPPSQAKEEEEPSGWDMWFNNRGDHDIDGEEFDSEEEMTLPLVELEPKRPAPLKEGMGTPASDKHSQGRNSGQGDKAAAKPLPSPGSGSPKPVAKKPSPEKPVVSSKNRPSAAATADTRQASKAASDKVKRSSPPAAGNRQPRKAPADKAARAPKQLDLYADTEHHPASGKDNGPIQDKRRPASASATKRTTATTKGRPQRAAAPVTDMKPPQAKPGGAPPRKENKAVQSAATQKAADATAKRSISPPSAPASQEEVRDKGETTRTTPTKKKGAAAPAKPATAPSSELASSMLNSARQQNRPRKAQASPTAAGTEKPRQQPAATPTAQREAAVGRKQEEKREKSRGKKASRHASEEPGLTPPTAEPEAATQVQQRPSPPPHTTGNSTASLPERAEADTPTQPKPVQQPSEAEPEAESGMAPGSEPAQEPPVETTTATPPPVSYAMQPELTQPRHTSGLSNLLWIAGIMTLCCTLLLQVIYYNRQQQANDPQLRPLLELMCRLTHCQLPPRRDVSRIELVEHLMQYHPNYQNSLLLTATIANHADFDQPYPLLEVVMSNIEQQVVASRHFLPQQYLSEELDPEALFPANSEVPLLLEVVDPGNEAVGFEFHFH